MPSELGGDDMLITGGTFNSATGDLHVHTHILSANEDGGIKLLYGNVASGAFHNSAERFDAPKCHPHTRKVILKEIMDWIADLDKSESFLWLYGPAGAGKSAILQSIAELCYKSRVVASFFFSRTAPGRSDSHLLVATLAYQLTISIPEIRQHVSAALDRDPIIFCRSLQAQVETLIFEPLTKVTASRGIGDGYKSKLQPISIIIDGLDECRESKTQRYILNVLSSAVQSSGLPIFFLIASRPEQDIRQAFNCDPLSSMTRRIVLDDNYEPDADIRVFLTSKFDEIKQHHPLKHHLPSYWPSDSEMNHLVQKASGQFIYASTVMKFVESPRHRPTERLKVVFGLEPPGKNMPFAELDALYIHILSSVDDTDAVTDVLVYLLFFDTLGERSRTQDMIEDFLSRTDGELQIILADLHSIVNVPVPNDLAGRVHFFHASLGDFLMDKARSGIFFIDAQHAHTRLARCCIKTVTFSLSTNSISRISTHDSYNALMEQCTMAYPTEELLRDLWNFNFTRFLNFGTTTRFFLRSPHAIASHLPGFFDWINKTNYLNCGNDLYTCYIHHFDKFLLTQLSCYPQEPFLYHILTTVTLLPTSSFIFTVFTDSMDPSEVKTFEEADNATLRLRRLGDMASGDFHLMLIAFFGDDARSGIYHITQSRYISLALKCLENLADANPSSRIRPKWIKRSSLDLLRRSLLRVPSDRQLGIYLRDNPNLRTIHFDYSLEIERLIDSYIKGCKLNTGLGSRLRKWFAKKRRKKEVVKQ